MLTIKRFAKNSTQPEISYWVDYDESMYENLAVVLEGQKVVCVSVSDSLAIEFGPNLFELPLREGVELITEEEFNTYCQAVLSAQKQHDQEEQQAIELSRNARQKALTGLNTKLKNLGLTDDEISLLQQ